MSLVSFAAVTPIKKIRSESVLFVLERYSVYAFRDLIHYLGVGSALHLRRHGGLLQVVGVQVLLQVEVRELLVGLHVQQRAQLGIRVDVVLVLQVLLLHVGRHELGDVGAALLAASGAAQEGAQLGGDVRGDLEDGHTGRLGLLALHGGLALPALVGQLLQLGRLLLQALGLSHQLRHHLAQSQQARGHGLHLGIQAHLLHLLGHGRHRGRGSSHSHRRGSSGGRRGSGLGSLGLGGRGGGHRGHHGGHGLLGLLAYLLRHGLAGSGAHYITGGGRSRGHFTHWTYG